VPKYDLERRELFLIKITIGFYSLEIPVACTSG
jgi:hypothetical protein